ncbi:MAG: hypothetical protein JNL60_16555 [Bacteroidia bacterium]|nr:hypothetical protein [Bacteroidia bacterium]
MNKTAKYGLYGAIGGSLINALFNIIKQLNEMDKEPGKEFDWGNLLGAAGKGAIVGGVGGLAVGAIADYQNDKEKPINTDAFLFTVIKDVKLDKNQSDFKRLDEKANRLIYLLKQKLGNKLASEPMRLGSTEKGTALSDNFDIDICLPFKHSSFNSTVEMYEYVLNFLAGLVGRESIVRIRDQKKSIGVILALRGEEYKIDIVPYKITNKRGNKTSGYLFLNDSTRPSYTKTDVHALKSLKLTDTQKKIVVVLKHWKTKNNLPLSSYLLENLVIDAYHYNEVPRKFTKKVIMVLEHIHNNLDVAVIKSIENSNNVLTNISDSKKAEIVAACKKAIEDYEYQPNSVLDTFEA